jgi:hypothetical protein
MEPFRDDNDLAAELRALRPAPRPAFAAELDQRAVAGVPQRSQLGASPLGRLASGCERCPQGVSSSPPAPPHSPW